MTTAKYKSIASDFSKLAQLAIFTYENEQYIKIVPSKKLLNSTMLYEVVTRGDLFALNMVTHVFTILPQGADCGILPAEKRKKPRPVTKIGVIHNFYTDAVQTSLPLTL